MSLNDGGPAFPYNYQFQQLLFHFGDIKKGEVGSEHTINRVRFPAEIQLLAYNSDLYENFTQAQSQPRGLLALGIIVDIGDRTNVELKRLAKAAINIKYRNQVVQIKHFQPSALLPHTDYYITYEGSLTFPGCFETVNWPLKAQNGRILRTNINIKLKPSLPFPYYSSPTDGNCPSNVYVDMGYQTNPKRTEKRLLQQPIYFGREKRKFTSEVSDFLVIEVLKRKTLLVENNTSRDLTFSEKKRNAWNDVRLLLSTRFVGFDQNIEAIKSHWRYRKRKVTDVFGEFNFSINHENKLKEKLTPIDLKIYEELRDSNMLQDCSMDIDNTSIHSLNIEENSNLNEENEKIEETFEKMRGKKRHLKVEEEFVKEKEDSPINSKVDEEPIESLQRKALIVLDMHELEPIESLQRKALIVCLVQNYRLHP
uniref:Alpha-carbonic anhydrase domain-containing protein n=1 Tax=Meloidogyne javanica TaxID=6303 RepID=A0A915MZN1_MELJA